MFVAWETRHIADDNILHGDRRDKLSSRKIEQSVAERSDGSRGNAAGTLTGTGRDGFLPVRHSSYICTLCTLDTESGAD
jgi:hypothetical protein